jgi:type II secretory pathway component HofQ
MRAAILAMMTLAATTARADGELCRRDVKHHGATIDLDVKGADIHDVLRLLVDVGRVNLVVSDEVSGKVTLYLHRVPWDQAACVIADVHHLDVTVEGNILVVRRRDVARK